MVMFLPGAMGEAFATATITVKFANLSSIPNLVLLSVRAVEAETGRSLASVFQTKKSSQVKLKVEAVPQMVFADLLSSDGNTLSVHSHVLRPVVDGQKIVVTLQPGSATSAGFIEATHVSDGLNSPSPDTTWPLADIALVGVPSSGFAVQGLDVSPRDISSMIQTDLSKMRCYNESGGFVVVLTDPEDLAAIKAEIDLSNSTWADSSTALQNRYVPPSYFFNGSWDSDGTTVTVTYRLVDSQGNELLSQSETGPADNIFNIHGNVLKDVAKDICCNQLKKIKCAKTGSIDINVDYDILHPDCPTDHQSIQGNIPFSLQPVVIDPQNACEYVGNGTSYFISDAECVNGLFQHETCTVSENIVGKVSKPAFPLCNALVVDFTEVWDCIEVDPFGTHSSIQPAAWTEEFQYTNGSVVDYPVTSPVVGHVRMILHLK